MPEELSTRDDSSSVTASTVQVVLEENAVRGNVLLVLSRGGSKVYDVGTREVAAQRFENLILGKHRRHSGGGRGRNERLSFPDSKVELRLSQLAAAVVGL